MPSYCLHDSRCQAQWHLQTTVTAPNRFGNLLQPPVQSLLGPSQRSLPFKCIPAPPPPQTRVSLVHAVMPLFLFQSIVTETMPEQADPRASPEPPPYAYHGSRRRESGGRWNEMDRMQQEDGYDLPEVLRGGDARACEQELRNRTALDWGKLSVLQF